MHRPLLLFLIVAVLAVSCKKDEVDYELRNSYFRNISTSQRADSTLTVMSYNIQCGFRPAFSPWDKGHIGGTAAYLDSMAAFIVASGADVIALQEVPLDRTNIVIKRLLDSLAHRLGMNYAFASHGYNDAYESGYPVRGQWGVAIMSRYPIEEIDSREVSYVDIWTRRSTLRARLRLDDSHRVDVYSLHHSPMTDYSDMRKTADFVHESSYPAIVCGDFNSGPETPAAYLGLAASLPDSLMSVDMIFHSKEFSARDAHFDPFAGLSDHYPVWVELRY